MGCWLYYLAKIISSSGLTLKRLNFGALVPILLSTLALTYLPSAFAEAPASISFSGKGYGHGVGMSQIGARGLALAGDTATAIVNYYYPGSEVMPLTDDQILRVNIGHQLTAASLRSDSPGASLQLISGDGLEPQFLSVLAAKDSVKLSVSDKQVGITTTQVGVTTKLIPVDLLTIRWSGTRYLAGTDSVLSLTHTKKTTRYRYGQIQVKVIKDSKLGNRLAIVNQVRLHDEYLWGISEVPSSWPAAALEAQAIASRSYAMSKVGKIQKSCDCELYSSISDQNFAGFAKEAEPRWGQIWKAAVSRTSTTETTGLTVTRNAAPIRTYFASSTGGVTETSKNAWGTDVGYTFSVPDPWSLDPKLNPSFYRWKRDIPQSLLAIAFGLPDVVSVKVLTLNETGTVKVIEARSSNGKKVKLSGETFRSRSKLPSTWFSLTNEELISVQN
jgi:SpoIID/LytB domain protein